MIKVSIFLIFAISCALAQQVKVPEKLSGTVPPLTPIVNTQNLYFVFSAQNLPSKDTNSGLVDPFVKVEISDGVYAPNSTTPSLTPLGVSETLDNDANPKWSKVFTVQYSKNTGQKLYVEVRDHDPLNPDDKIGSAYIDLDRYVSSGQEFTETLGGKSGSITIKQTTPFLFKLAVKNVPALDEFGGLSDPFVKCYFRYGKEGKDVKFYETKSIDNTENASWEDNIAFDNYQQGTNQFLHFKVKDSDTITGDDEIGEAFLEVDPFFSKKMPSVLTLSTTNNATLIVSIE